MNGYGHMSNDGKSYMAPSPYSQYMPKEPRNMQKYKLNCYDPQDPSKVAPLAKEMMPKRASTCLNPSMQPAGFQVGPNPIPNNQSGMSTAERMRETFYINKITNNYYQIGKNQKTPQKGLTPHDQSQPSNHQQDPA